MEQFQLVDAEGRPVGAAERSACHRDPSLIHLVVHLHVLDAAGRLYLQRRALNKDTNPGRWDTSVGGHVGAGEPAGDALLREAREELGIDATAARFLYSFLYRAVRETELARSYLLVHEGPLSPDPGEIIEGRFLALDEVRSWVGTGRLTPLFEYELPMLLAALRSPG